VEACVQLEPSKTQKFELSSNKGYLLKIDLFTPVVMGDLHTNNVTPSEIN
jgi:hypothetical protein